MSSRELPAPGAGRRADPPSRPAEPTAVHRTLAVSFGAIGVAFAVGLALSHRFIVQIQASAAEITGNTSPSISELSELRSTLRQLQVATARHLRACPGPRCGAGADQLAQLQERLRQTWHRYRLLPTSPGESTLWPRVDADLNRVGEALAVTVEAARAGRRDEADRRYHEQLAPAFDWVDAGIARIKDGEHTFGTEAATRIGSLADLATLAFVAVGSLTLALTLLAGGLSVRHVRRADRAMRDRADDLELFASRVAHDLEGPLASTASALQGAARLASGPARDEIGHSQRRLQRVRSLVDDLLDFARAGASGRGGAAAVHEVVDEVVGDLSDVAAENRVEVRVEALARERVACSRGVLASVVQNLLRNAISHMGDSEVRVVRVRASQAPGGRRVRIEVEDSGPGLPPGAGDTVFEPVVRGAGAAPSAGLGLATVKRFVSAHGGRLGFRPTPRRGTLFWLEMPRTGGRRSPHA